MVTGFFAARVVLVSRFGKASGSVTPRKQPFASTWRSYHFFVYLPDYLALSCYSQVGYILPRTTYLFWPVFSVGYPKVTATP